MKISILPLAIVTAVAIVIKNIRIEPGVSVTADIDYLDEKDSVLKTGRETITGADYDAWRNGNDGALADAIVRQIGGAKQAAVPIAAPPVLNPAPEPPQAEEMPASVTDEHD